jgi:hypothetical protein
MKSVAIPAFPGYVTDFLGEAEKGLKIVYAPQQLPYTIFPVGGEAPNSGRPTRFKMATLQAGSHVCDIYFQPDSPEYVSGDIVFEWPSGDDIFGPLANGFREFAEQKEAKKPSVSHRV